MKILHILRDSNDPLPLSMANTQRGQGEEVSILLIHDAVYASVPKGFKVFASRDDVQARGVTPDGAELIDYPQIVDLIVEHDSVTVW
ncbi:MAG: sulfurtransferase complex subunit TusB [Chloroflexi bacterium]|nr:sulfurtransferase complex subunit TusB [Chloroflexota bacterium]